MNARKQSERLVASTREHATIMTKGVGEGCAHFLVLHDYAGLEALLFGAMQQPDILRIQVSEPDGILVGDVEVGSDGKPRTVPGLRRIAVPQALAPATVVENGDLVVWQPITAGSPLGWIKATYDMSSIRALRLETLKNSLLLALLWVAGSAVALLLVMRRAVRSFNKLTNFARQLDEHKGAEISVKSRVGEIADLATSLNHASKRLQASEQQLVSDRERLRTNEEKHRQLLDTVQEGIWVIDKESITTFVNPRLAEILGYVPEEMLGQPLFAFMDEQGQAVAKYNVERRKQGIKEQHDFEFIRKDGGRIYARLETGPILDEAGQYAGAIAAVDDITLLRLAEQERVANLRFFESMDQVNRAIQVAPDVDSMMGNVLDLVLSIFGCDRAFLLHPCDPEAPAWVVPMERTKAEFPGALVLGAEIPMSPEVAETLRILLAADGPVRFGPAAPHPLPADVSERFGFKCLMSMALRPKTGEAWQFGIHQCSHVRIWTAEEERLFQEIGRRLADGLTSLLASQELHKLNEELEARVKERTTELEAKNTALEKMNKLFVGRELRMVELKERIMELEKK
ncbi:MAG: PAS domain S-box protein [Desulfobulbaceae bacterium]|nr:PAS domain S-box protein [Desulfobulbaceae bacterium]